MILIKNAEVYGPEPLGRRDVFLAGGRICQISEEGEEIDPGADLSVQVIDGSRKYLVPGFIDCHQHILGGGGEGGFSTRTPEVMLTDLTKNGITTVVGVIGTDGVSRTMENLVAKARGLIQDGVSAYVYSGSYQVPLRTLTGDLMKDIMMIDLIIGAGEIAISDHRSSQPSFEEFRRIAAEARTGGMLSGKAGIVNVHLGDSPRCMDLIERVVEETEILPSQFLPTHVNRNAALFERAVQFAKKGGTVDFTGNEEIDRWETLSDEVRVSRGIRRLLDEGVSSDQFTISSDGQGSLPVFNEKGEMVGMGVGKASSLLKEVKDCVKNGIPLETALKAVTSNPARILKLPSKGRIVEGGDADICLLGQKGLEIDTVIAKGRVMLRGGVTFVRGIFEPQS